MREESFSIENPMPPLWMRYPEFPHLSKAWNEGNGASYQVKFSSWLFHLSLDDRKRYKEMFPAPKTWMHYYDDAGDLDHGKLDTTTVGTPNIHLVHLWNEHGTPEYSKEKLMKTTRKDSSSEYVFFWKPDPRSLEASLGQWQPTLFRQDKNEYHFAEQYMMSEKARLFGDTEIEKQMMESTDPKQIKALGRKVSPFDPLLWDKAKYAVVLNGNYAKFTQNPVLRDYLLSTKDKILVEASPLDTIWGIGLAKDNLQAMEAKSWRGTNLLGFALMEVRDEISRVYQNFYKVNWSLFP